MKTHDNRIRAIGKAINKQDTSRPKFVISWRDDDLCEWPLPNGEIELITEAEYKRRGGVVISWDDIDECD